MDALVHLERAVALGVRALDVEAQVDDRLRWTGPVAVRQRPMPADPGVHEDLRISVTDLAVMDRESGGHPGGDRRVGGGGSTQCGRAQQRVGERPYWTGKGNFVVRSPVEGQVANGNYRL